MAAVAAGVGLSTDALRDFVCRAPSLLTQPLPVLDARVLFMRRELRCSKEDIALSPEVLAQDINEVRGKASV